MKEVSRCATFLHIASFPSLQWLIAGNDSKRHIFAECNSSFKATSFKGKTTYCETIKQLTSVLDFDLKFKNLRYLLGLQWVCLEGPGCGKSGSLRISSFKTRNWS